MTDLRKAAEMALEALNSVPDWDCTYPIGKAKEALRQALAEQEPEAWLVLSKDNSSLSLYAPKREWVGLTKEEAKEISMANRPYVIDMIAALEAKLKEKNA